MRFGSRIVLCLLAAVVVAGCASTKVTQQTPRASYVTGRSQYTEAGSPEE